MWSTLPMSGLFKMYMKGEFLMNKSKILHDKQGLATSDNLQESVSSCLEVCPLYLCPKAVKEFKTSFHSPVLRK